MGFKLAAVGSKADSRNNELALRLFETMPVDNARLAVTTLSAFKLDLRSRDALIAQLQAGGTVTAIVPEPAGAPQSQEPETAAGM